MNNPDQVILDFAEADRDGIGNKARHLARLHQLRPQLFHVPEGLVLLPAYDHAQHSAALKARLQTLGPGPYAVRSCGLNEDGINESMAGKFYTELHVAGDALPVAIDQVRASFGEALATSAVLIQPMIEPDFAGVLFTRSPENHGLASCEFGSGTADAVVSGKVEPVRVDYGRWTGTLYGAASRHEPMLSLVFLAGMVIEEKMGAAQDIEWAYDAKRARLYILQSRDITSHLYEPGIASEQERVAELALAGKYAQKGLPVFQNSAVREVVAAPTRLTRSMIERLYAPSGALGRALQLLQLPCPALTQPYIVSVFGRLYANAEVERTLFGPGVKSLWATHKLKKRIQQRPEELLGWLDEAIASFPAYPVDAHTHYTHADDAARAVAAGARTFIEQVYPIAYAATLLAQLAGEEDAAASLTSQLMRDLSRLHHTGEQGEFLEKWGRRSANDYELAEPRFCEAPAAAVTYAGRFANFPWGAVEAGRSFTHFKELAKDRAIRWLYDLRVNVLTLERVLGLDPGQVFFLGLEDIEAIAAGEFDLHDVRAVCEMRLNQESHWAALQLGDEITLESIERLTDPGAAAPGLHGRMVSVRKGFSGVARQVAGIADKPLSGNEVLITPHLTPELVGHYSASVGCISDMGGALSHAAIVARELDYPVLVLAGASTTLRDGDLIEVSAEGVVTLRR
ncbi:MAG: PEP/pyruvate-binding domain-containing protein [Pseudomonadota bacterium]